MTKFVLYSLCTMVSVYFHSDCGKEIPTSPPETGNCFLRNQGKIVAFMIFPCGKLPQQTVEKYCVWKSKFFSEEMRYTHAFYVNRTLNL